MQPLRVVTPDASTSGPWTLRQAFEQHVRPQITGRRAAATIRNYETALRHWERFCRAMIDQTTEETAERASSTTTRALGSPAAGGSPAVPFEPIVEAVDDVPAITDAALDAFGLWLISAGGAGLSVATAGKTWGSGLRPILRKLGPRETGNPRALGLLDRVPTMQPLELLELDDDDSDEDDSHAADLSDEQLAALYHACECATWPAGPSPAPLQWKAYLVLSLCMGLRPGDASTLRTAWLRLDPASPARGSSRTHAAGWLVWIPTKTKRKKRGRLILPLVPAVRRHLDAVRWSGDRVFAWSSYRVHSFGDQWNQIAAQAGLAGLERRKLRSSCAARWNRISDGQLGRWVLGHAARDVHDRHYMNHEADLIDAALRLPLPPCFTGSPTGERQPLFF